MPQKLQCEVIEIVDHGEQVYSVILKPNVRVPRFLPGQFLHLALDPYNPGDFWPESRVFSIASAPTERNLLRITYAVKGKFTSRMEAELRVGGEVWIKLPYGEFIITPETDICLLAGGTGITAFTAFISGLPATYEHQVYLFYGARQPDLLIYRPMIEIALHHCSDLHVVFIAEQSLNRTDCLPGRINLDLVWKSIPDPLATTHYLAGPPGMLQVLQAGLIQRNVSPDLIKIDAWE